MLSSKYQTLKSEWLFFRKWCSLTDSKMAGKTDFGQNQWLLRKTTLKGTSSLIYPFSQARKFITHSNSSKIGHISYLRDGASFVLFRWFHLLWFLFSLFSCSLLSSLDFFPASSPNRSSTVYICTDIIYVWSPNCQSFIVLVLWKIIIVLF